MPNPKTICVVGLGYIGLPTAAMFATSGFKVFGVDIKKSIVDNLNRGSVEIFEPNLEQLVSKEVKLGNLCASRNIVPADVFIVAVPTPTKGVEHRADLSSVEAAFDAISKVIKNGDLIVLESTVPVGTTLKMTQRLSKARPDLRFPATRSSEPDVNIAFCPERVLPGKILEELVANDRTIGGVTPACGERAASLYKNFVKGECVLCSSPSVAELAKLTENSFRDVNIAFANELSMLAVELGVDVWELINIANRHPRVSILSPGTGVGGHCIAVDPWFIVGSAPNTTKLIRTAREVNNQKPFWVIDKVKTQAQIHPFKPLICYGLAFKPDIDDLRESPSLIVYEELCRLFGERVQAIEPNIEKNEEKRINLLSMEEAFSTDAIHILLVEHKEFLDIKMTNKLVMDYKGIW